MTAKIATIGFCLCIWVLFALDRNSKSRTSKALWIPVLWLCITGSRPVSLWLSLTGLWNSGPVDVSERYLDGSPLDRAVFSALLAAGIIALLRRKRQTSQLLRANTPILLFFLYCAISVYWSGYPDVALKRWIKALGDIVMVLIVLTDPDKDTAVRRFIARPAFLLIPMSVLLCKYYPDIAREYSKGWVTLYSGVCETKNTLGMICLLFGLGSAWRFIGAWGEPKCTQRTKQLIAHGTLLLMVMWLFRMANSMTSLSCFLLAGGLLGATSIYAHARKPLVVHVFVTAIVIVSFSALFLDVGSGALQAMGRDPTLTGRTEIWKLVLTLAGNPVFGTGFESFWMGERLHKVWETMDGIQEAHNGYLEVFLNLGWAGLSLLAIIIGAGYRRVLRTLRRETVTAPLMLAYFVVGVIYNFTEAGFRMMTPVWITFLLGTMTLGKNPRLKNAAAPVVPPEGPDHILEVPAYVLKRS